MDARKYASKYVKPDNVRDGPIQTRIVNVFEEENYGRLALELETGSQFSLNDGNTNALIKAWGHDTDGWIGLETELALELGDLYGLERRSAEGKRKPSRSARSRRDKQPLAKRQRAGGKQAAVAAEQDGGKSPPRTICRRRNSVLSDAIVCHGRSCAQQETDLAQVQLFACLAPARGERMPALRWNARMQSEGVTWTDHRRLDRAVNRRRQVYRSDLQEFGQALRAEGVEAGIKIGRRGKQWQRQWSPHAARAFGDGGILPRPAQSIEGRQAARFRQRHVCDHAAGNEPVAGAAGVSRRAFTFRSAGGFKMATVLEVRQALVDHGYVPIPVIGKTPPFKSWQKVENVSRAMLEAWGRNWPRATNTGILDQVHADARRRYSQRARRHRDRGSGARALRGPRLYPAAYRQGTEARDSVSHHRSVRQDHRQPDRRRRQHRRENRIHVRRPANRRRRHSSRTPANLIPGRSAIRPTSRTMICPISARRSSELSRRRQAPRPRC